MGCAASVDSIQVQEEKTLLINLCKWKLMCVYFPSVPSKPSLTALVLLSSQLVFIPDNQQHVLSGWTTTVVWCWPGKVFRVVSLASSAGPTQVQDLAAGNCLSLFNNKWVYTVSLWTKVTTSNWSTWVPFWLFGEWFSFLDVIFF